MENEQTLILSGTSQNAYTFTIYPFNATLVSFGAVYLVLRLDKTGYFIIYIGRSSALYQDLRHHPLMPEFDQAGKTHIGVHIEATITERYKKQMDLVVRFAPLLNM
ncbi:MAG: hypothetical protein COA54_10915 [Thiotrichaceae bacterium]|nr:MAG: hypothetical protein COA54_10915 [Thiotrichaceae bacterium]